MSAMIEEGCLDPEKQLIMMDPVECLLYFSNVLSLTFATIVKLNNESPRSKSRGFLRTTTAFWFPSMENFLSSLPETME